MLPSGSIPWPPKEVKQHYARVGRWDALYSSSLAALAATAPTDKRNRLQFWARRAKDGKTRPQIHVPFAAELASLSADLLVGTAPQVVGDERYDLTDHTNTLLEAAEVAAALGGAYLRPAWDTTVADEPFLSVVHPDAAIPTFRGPYLASVIFWTEVKIVDATIWRLLEEHSSTSDGWMIDRRLYAGTKDRLGVEAPVDALDETADLDNEPIFFPGRLGVAYFPNMRPDREDRRSAYGRSDYQGVEPLFDALDETWTSWMRDLRLGQARIIVPETYLDTAGKGEGQTFDVDRELFTPVARFGDPDRDQITLSQFNIRTAEHRDTMLGLVERIASTAGYAPADVGLQIEGRAESGTALRQRRARTFSTIERKRRYLTPALRTVLRGLVAIDVEIFGGPQTDEDPMVEWQDPIDLPETANTVDLIARATAASTDTKVRLLHPEWNDDQVAGEVGRIHAEQGIVPPLDLGTIP